MIGGMQENRVNEAGLGAMVEHPRQARSRCLRCLCIVLNEVTPIDGSGHPPQNPNQGLIVSVPSIQVRLWLQSLSLETQRLLPVEREKTYRKSAELRLPDQPDSRLGWFGAPFCSFGTIERTSEERMKLH